MRTRPSVPWQVATVVLYGLAAGVGLVATIRSFDRGLDVVLIAWTFGMIAGFFAVVLAVMGLVAFIRHEDDRSDLRSFVGVILFLLSSIVTTGLSGVIASGLLLVAWLVGRSVGHRYRQAWRQEFTDRQDFFRRLGKGDPRDDRESERFLGLPRAVDASSEDSEPASKDAYAVTRSELKKRAREFDQDPWQAPPD